MNIPLGFLLKEYVKNRKSPRAIANQLGCSRSKVLGHLMKFGISFRCQSEALSLFLTGKLKVKRISKDFLINEYLRNEKTINEISSILGCSSNSVIRDLRFYGIKIRTRSELFRKNKNPRWNGGITPLGGMIRSSPENEKWQLACLKRDNYTCQKCNTRGCYLQVHHKKQFSIILAEFLQTYSMFSPIEDKETLVRLATGYHDFWDVDNGKTLCLSCHKQIPVRRS